MTKAEAIERLEKDCCKSRVYCELYPDACMKEECEVYMAIEALKERPKGEWIPCSERLPEMVHDELIGDFCNSDPCIITYERHGCRWTAETTFVYCSDGLWRYCPNAEDEVYMPINDDCSIVAWMPLPEAMKEGESNG